MRLIDADALKTNCDIMVGDRTIGRRDYVMFHEIDSAPTVVEFKDTITKVMVRGVEYIPVVRCKDCIHYESDGGEMMVCGITDMVGDDDDYCSYGVREEGE